MKNICVFCGSSIGENLIYKQKAEELGKLIVDHGLRLVYGGGNIGLMGVIADSVLQHGGEVIGVIPEFLKSREVGHEQLTELIVVNSMHERKLKMAELADAFIAMPGGYGTLEELAEITTWVQLGLMNKSIGILNVNGFYDSLINQITFMKEQRFISIENHQMLIFNSDPQKLLELLVEDNDARFNIKSNLKPT